MASNLQPAREYGLPTAFGSGPPNRPKKDNIQNRPIEHLISGGSAKSPTPTNPTHNPTCDDFA